MRHSVIALLTLYLLPLNGCSIVLNMQMGCDEEHSYCPSGTECVDGWCVDDGADGDRDDCAEGDCCESPCGEADGCCPAGCDASTDTDCCNATVDCVDGDGACPMCCHTTTDNDCCEVATDCVDDDGECPTCCHVAIDNDCCDVTNDGDCCAVDTDCNSSESDGYCWLCCDVTNDIDCCNAAICGAADDCCPLGCAGSDDVDCCNVAPCGSEDGCCPLGCARRDDVDCCNGAICGAADGCCPSGCLRNEDVDCCNVSSCGFADGCCPLGCSGSEDVDCCGVALCGSADDCCPSGCAAGDDVDCCEAATCGFADGCCPPGCPISADADCCELSLCGDWVNVPSGTFAMGASCSDTERYSNEAPQHNVVLTRAYEIQATEVTQDQFREVMGYNPLGSVICGDCPIGQVTWYEAAAYCNALSELSGLDLCYECWGSRDSVECEPSGAHLSPYQCPGYRLPTEAEWENAARSGTTTARYGDLDEVAWYLDNSHGVSHPVGEKAASLWGLHDMLGNVWEWCHDWYEEGYPVETVEDPWGPDEGIGRALRGGSWGYVARGSRATARFGNTPDYSYIEWGFRPVRSLP